MVEISRKLCKAHSTLPKAITFDPTVGFSIYLVFWKLDIQKFPGTPRSAQSKSGKAFKYVFKAGLVKARTANVSRGGRRPI